MNRRNALIAGSLILGTIATGGLFWPNRWKYIIIHHSAGNYGNVPFLQKVHRERQAKDPIDAIPYHYIIGNGNGMEMGEIASDWRQDYNIWGAHVSMRNSDINFRGLGICLIGNYEANKVPPKQYAALVNLTRKLMSKYAISVDKVYGHGFIPGESTKCPGKHFPMQTFLSDIV